MYDHDDNDWDPDITGDPALDQFGYQSPKRPPYHPVRWDGVEQLAQQHREQRAEWKRQQEERRRKRDERRR
jgi:hypothetical protein